MTLDEVLDRLREVNQPVPRPLRRPTNAEIELAERELGVKFHPDYRSYLLAASDVVFGTLEPCTVGAGGHTDLVSAARDAWRFGVPRELLPICEDNGDFYCLDRGGEVVFWSHDGTTDERWSNLAEWIEKVWLREG